MRKNVYFCNIKLNNILWHKTKKNRLNKDILKRIRFSKHTWKSGKFLQNDLY